MSQYWDLSTVDKRRMFNEYVMQMVVAGKKPCVKFEEPLNHRTSTQNASMHLWFEMVATYLNDAGYDMRKTLRQDMDIPWSQNSVKEYLWRPVQKAVTGEESTTKPSKTDYGDIYQSLSRHFSQKFGLTLPEWPHR